MKWNDLVRLAERELLLDLGRTCRWNQCEMARSVGVHRNTMRRKLQGCGINTREKYLTQKLERIRATVEAQIQARTRTPAQMAQGSRAA